LVIEIDRENPLPLHSVEIRSEICRNGRLAYAPFQISDQQNWNALVHMAVVAVRFADRLPNPKIVVILESVTDPDEPVRQFAILRLQFPDIGAPEFPDFIPGFLDQTLYRTPRRKPNTVALPPKRLAIGPYSVARFLTHCINAPTPLTPILRYFLAGPYRRDRKKEGCPTQK